MRYEYGSTTTRLHLLSHTAYITGTMKATPITGTAKSVTIRITGTAKTIPIALKVANSAVKSTPVAAKAAVKTGNGCAEDWKQWNLSFKPPHPTYSIAYIKQNP